MKVSELYHLIKQQTKSKLGALQLIPSFEIMYEPQIHKILPTEEMRCSGVDWARTISSNNKTHERITTSTNRSKFTYVRFDAFKSREANPLTDSGIFDKTQTYRVPTFDLSKMSKRKSDHKFRNTMYCAEFYNPNKDITMIKMNNGVPKFERQSKRSTVNSIYRHKRDNSPEIYNYQNLMKAYDKLGHIKSKIPSPDFKRQSSIDKSEEIKSKRKMMSLYSILNKTAKAMVD